MPGLRDSQSYARSRFESNTFFLPAATSVSLSRAELLRRITRHLDYN